MYCVTDVDFLLKKICFSGQPEAQLLHISCKYNHIPIYVIYRSVNEYMLGSEKRLELDVIVENKNEDSFETTFLMPMPAGVNYIKVERKEKAEHEFLVQCSAPSQTNNNTLRCDLGNPLPKNRFVRFNILLMPSLTEVMKPRYEFKMNVNSTNPEQEDTTHDNSLQLTVPIWVDAELELHG